MQTQIKKQRYLEKKVNIIGFLDIETKTDNFKAQDGYLLTWVLKQLDLRTMKSKTYYMAIEGDQNILKDENEFFDRHLLIELVKTMKECDLIVTHYGTWFDIPFIRTRCKMQGLEFITHSDKIRFADTWKMARLTGSYRRNSLDNVAETLGVRTKKTVVKYVQWKKAYRGNKKAIAYILDHNQKDVKITEAVWRKLEDTNPIPARYY